jgi:sirohydrochlorin cobaltochelatase
MAVSLSSNSRRVGLLTSECVIESYLPVNVMREAEPVTARLVQSCQAGGGITRPRSCMTSSCDTRRVTEQTQEADTRDALEGRLRTMLPEQYQDAYEDVQPVSMGSAPLKFGADGKVAWDAMWGSFCDLAMAGGPPHKGRLLSPAAADEIAADPDRYGDVVEEICRGIGMVSYLPAERAAVPGWIRVECMTEGMAGWLLRAILMENVSARAEGCDLYMPAGPAYRLEKEIKNVVTVIAKTSHYWLEHMYLAQQRAIADLFLELEKTTPLVPPGPMTPDAAERLATLVARSTGLRASSHDVGGWLGLECPSVEAAVWMMRALVASNVLARREEAVLFVPVNAERDPDGAIVASVVSRIHAFATAAAVL